MTRLKLALIIFGLLFSILPASAQEKSDFQVILLGTGSPPPLMHRFGPSTLVQVGGKNFLFDVGRGVTQRLWQKKIALGKIDYVLVTHLHSDHVVGIPDLLMTGWLRGPFAFRKHAFRVFGPTGTVNMMTHIRKAYGWDIKTRMEDQKIPEAGVKVEAHNIKAGTVYEADGVKVTAFDTNHGKLIKPTLGYRVDYDGRSVVLSGDTKYSDNLIAHAKGVDVIIHSIGAARPELLASHPRWGRILDHHIGPEDAGRVFTATKPKMAIYSHIVALTNGKIKPVFPPMLVKRTRTTYQGPLIVGKDLMTITIAKSGISIAEHKMKMRK